MNGLFFFKRPSGTGTIVPPDGTTYTFGTPAGAFSATQGSQLGSLLFSGDYNIPAGSLGSATFGSTTFNGVFNTSGFIPAASPVVPNTTSLGSQAITINTTNLSSNIVYTGSINVIASGGSGSNYSFGSLVGTYSMQQGQSVPTITFTGGNLPQNTAVNMIIPITGGTNTSVTGIINSVGVFIPSNGQTVPATALTGSQSVTLSTTSLGSNINTAINVTFISSSTTVAVQLNKAIIFGTNGNQYTVLDLNTNTAIGATVNSITNYNGGNYTKQIKRNASGTTLYKVDGGFGLVKLNWDNGTNTLAFNSAIATPNPATSQGLAYSELDNLAFVASKNTGNNTSSQLVITVINTNSMTILNTLTYPIHEYNYGQIAFDSVNKYLYINGRRAGGEASVLRITVNTTDGTASNPKQWDYKGGGYTGWGLGLNTAGDKLVVSVPSLSGDTGNVLILNTSQFSAGQAVYSFQGTPAPVTLPSQTLTGINGQQLNITMAGEKYVIGSGALISSTVMGQIGVGINTTPSPTQSEVVGLTPNGDKMVQIGYGSSVAQIRTFTGATQGSTIATVQQPQAVIAL